MTNIIESISKDARTRAATCGAVRVIAIDGPAGAGKTTLAHFLSTQLDNCPVVSMDSVYNGWKDALTESTFQRISEQIFQPLERGITAQYQSYDWYEEKFTSWREIEPTNFVIIEGVGSSNPTFRPFLTLTIWVEADEKLLLKRVLKRDGEQIREHMVNWQHVERIYFQQTGAKAFADFVFQT